MNLGKYLALSEPGFSAVRWDDESRLLGFLQSLSEMWLYRALSKCPVSAGPLLWVSYVWWGRGT